MKSNKTVPTGVSIEAFLESVSDFRRVEARVLTDMMQQLSNEEPYMWGPSIIGFGTIHFKYESGREGDTPRLAFSPRKSAITIYFSEGFDPYSENLSMLGKYKQSVSCLYINKLADINLNVLQNMLEKSFQVTNQTPLKPTLLNDYIDKIPGAARHKFDELRQLVKLELSSAEEVLSYGIIGYKVDDKRPRVFISGWKDHLAMYPVPSNESLKLKLAPYIRGRNTLWFSLEKPLPKPLIKAIVKALTS